MAPLTFTWTKYNAQGQPLSIVLPAGNTINYTYETGVIPTFASLYLPRRGLLLSKSRVPGNSLGITPFFTVTPDQNILTQRYFYEPLFNRICASIEERGNPINPTTGAYYTPQNGGTTPTNADCSRYATINIFDYQKDTITTVAGDATLQALLGLGYGPLTELIDYVSRQMSATDGTGGIPAGFLMNQGDISNSTTTTS